MPSLKDVAKEWEMEDAIRSQLRANKHLLQKEAWKDDIKIDVKHAEMNFAVLAPLAKRLLDSKDKVGMHTVPKVMQQILGFNMLFL